MRSNTCEKVERREDDEGEGRSRERGFIWDVEEIPETDGEGCRQDTSPIMKAPRSTKPQLRAAQSVPPATTKRQQPSNKHPLMNREKESLIERHGEFKRVHVRGGAPTCPLALSNGHGGFLCGRRIG